MGLDWVQLAKVFSSLLAGIGTLIMACMTYKHIKQTQKALKVEKLRNAFINIAKELAKMKEDINENLDHIRNLYNNVITSLIKIAYSGNIRENLELHYRERLDVLSLIDKCRHLIGRYNERLSELKFTIEEELKDRLASAGISIYDNRLTQIYCDLRRKELLKLAPGTLPDKDYINVSLDVLIDAVLKGLDNALRERNCSASKEQELYRLLDNIVKDIRSSGAFQRFREELKALAPEIEESLMELELRLNDLINEIMKEFYISQEELREYPVK